MKKKLIQQTIIILTLIFLSSFAIRYLQIKDNKIYFWYDQARDAYVSRQIVENKDLKIQGPSASGTNDTIYHGVAYYYLIGPLYTLFAGDPMKVAIVLTLINSLAVLPLYYLTKKITKSKFTALLASFLLAVSFEHTQYSGWLSNPSMSLIPILFFYLSIWNIFYEQEKKILNFVILGLSLGLIEQSAFYTLYMWGSVLVGFFYLYTVGKGKFSTKQLKGLLWTLIVYAITISTMILTQLKLFLAGIFSFNNIISAVGEHPKLVNLTQIGELFSAYGSKLFESIIPLYPILSFLILIILVWFFIQKLALKKQIFLGSWLLAPLWLYVIHFRDSVHMLMGIEYVLIIVLAMVVFELLSKKTLRVLGIILVTIFVLGQLKAIIFIRENNNSIFTFQEDVLLEHQLELVDRTYQLANGEDFSIALWNTPFEYYIDWAYLYDWYGKGKYGYVPSYVGTSQMGKFGPELLIQTDTPAAHHFSIYEPKLTLVGDFKQQFENQQNEYGQPVVIDPEKQLPYQLFGTYRLEYRQFKID